MDNDNRINVYMVNNPKERAPHIKGFITINGVVHEVALWPAKNGKDGSYSGNFKPKQDTPTPHNQSKSDGYAPKPANDFVEDSIPF
jgi:hypothetical protein